jgi:hypothetical protein
MPGRSLGFWRSSSAPARRLRPSPSNLSEAYLSAVRWVFGETLDVVHDPCHVVALANQAIDETCRVLAHTLQHEDARILKGSRFLLLRGFEHLAEEGREALRVLMKLNRPLYEVYIL